jgi:patatin-like phospholipase/acyl hydrolase
MPYSRRKKTWSGFFPIDGGGIRGIVPAMMLAEIERRTEKPIAQLFDSVDGTSTGGIIALGLTIPKCPGAPLYSARHYVELYGKLGGRIFSRSLARTMLTMDSFTWKSIRRTGSRPCSTNTSRRHDC